MKTGLKIGSAIVGAFMLSGCDTTHYKSKKETDEFVQKLLITTQDDQNLVNRYHIMENKEGEHLGVVFIRSVKSNDTSLVDCATYQAYATNPYNNWLAKESANRHTCAGRKPN